ncbi:alpha/beta hydrolase [Pilimelia terevasa]|uniref:Alpha/beta hydrolase n=1 Tax=Pilimelia terevasa TaxID=53372 RepID=A0A8J3BGA5_9ACTN|nr:alpha/beta hydrolase [Pilimelia terevasa]GGK12880.1 alpha/beta hydrolase [Pilimelia terevasa]
MSGVQFDPVRGTRPADPPGPYPGSLVTRGGASLYLRRTPVRDDRAEPALYLHGLGGSAHNWTDLAGRLADRLAGEAVDLPGFGHSPPAGAYSVASVAARMVGWIGDGGRGPVHLVGNSFGGAVAVRVAALRPDLVRTLTLISPAMPFLDARRTVHGPMLPLLALPGASRIAGRQLARTAPEDLTRQVLEACFGDPGRLTPQRVAEAVAEVGGRYREPYYPAVYVRTLRGLVWAFLRAYLPGPGSLWAMARRLTVPTLVIGGTLDRIIDVRVAPRVADAVPGARLSMLEGVGHVAMMEVPGRVAREIRRFLAAR